MTDELKPTLIGIQEIIKDSILTKGLPPSPAEWMYNRLVEYIKNFENKLDYEHEVGARLVSFGQSITFHISNIGYYGPDIISFYGTDEKGQAVQLIQHTSQLSVLLIAVEKKTDKPLRIGFDLEKRNKDNLEGG
jgi:hypothetical protein